MERQGDRPKIGYDVEDGVEEGACPMCNCSHFIGRQSVEYPEYHKIVDRCRHCGHQRVRIEEKDQG